MPNASSGGGGHGLSPSSADQQTCEQKPSTQQPVVHMSSLVHGAYMLSSAGSPALELSPPLESAGASVELSSPGASVVELVVVFVVADVPGLVVSSGGLSSPP